MRYSINLFFTLFFTIGLFSQNTDVSGTVTDNEDGTPIPGVNVVLEGTARGTQTDFDGNYAISNVPDAGKLVFFKYRLRN